MSAGSTGRSHGREQLPEGRMSVIAIDGVPEIREGDDLAALLI